MEEEKHRCFICFKKEDSLSIDYKQNIIDKLTEERTVVRALDDWIDSDDIDYVINEIRNKYMSHTSVTLYLIGPHSSENEGIDDKGYNKQNFIIRELRATLFDGDDNNRSGLLGIVLPEMMSKIYGGLGICDKCGASVNIVNINNSTVIREFSENYWLQNCSCGGDHYLEKGRFCTLVPYSIFMLDPDKYINEAFAKTRDSIADFVHWRDIKHKGKVR